jgi:adenylate cyclase
VTCAGCGFDAPPDFAFCPKCGTKFPSAPAAAPAALAAERSPAPTPLESDRRLVTVLFADLSGFTALSERLDPEDVRAFQSDLFREMAQAIERYEGFVEKFVGDAVMAVFGAPVAHDDDPERGLHAALAMQERMGGLNRRWSRRLGRSLALHVGLNTGPVVAGRIGAAAEAAYAVTGDTVNTASRLQSAAEPGEVLVSESTRRLTEHAFAFAPRGALSLKGRREPVAAYRVLGALAAPRARRGLESLGLVAPLIGRDAELEQMLGVFDRMRAGGGQVLSLIGEPGAGKSRLQREFFARLEEDGRLAGVAVRRASCSALGQQTYGAVAALLRDAYGVAPGDPLEIARAKLEAGLEALGVVGEDTARLATVLSLMFGLERDDAWRRHLDPEQLKQQIFMATGTLVERRLDDDPLLLAVEDLHWADAASVELLGAVADRLADRPLMLLLTYRPALEPAALGVTSAEHTTIRLGALSSRAGSDLLSAWFGGAERRFPERLRASSSSGRGATRSIWRRSCAP